MSDDIVVTETTTTKTIPQMEPTKTPEVVAAQAENGFFKKLASRRFTMAILVIIVSSVMMWRGLIEPGNYETLMIWISGIYIIGKPFGDQVARFLVAK